MLTLYDSTTSVCAIKVRLALHEKCIPFQSHNIDLRAGDQFDPDYMKLNPNAVVPTLVDDNKIVIESSVILQYVDDVHPKPSLLPTDPYDRSQMRLWMKLIDEVLHPAIGSLTHATAYRPGFLKLNKEAQAARLDRIPDENRRSRFAQVYEDGLRSPVAIHAVKVINSLITDMETALTKSDYLAGLTYSLADCAATPYANRLFDLGLLGFWASQAPKVTRWYNAIRERANFGPAITDYLTDADRILFEATDPEAPSRVREIIRSS